MTKEEFQKMKQELEAYVSPCNIYFFMLQECWKKLLIASKHSEIHSLSNKVNELKYLHLHISFILEYLKFHQIIFK